MAKQSWLDRAVNKLCGTLGPEHGTNKVTWYETAGKDDDSDVWTGYGAPPALTPDEQAIMDSIVFDVHQPYCRPKKV